MVRGGNLEIEQERYEDDVAVVSVPSTFLLVRNGGVPVITGQCTNFGWLYGMSPRGFVGYARSDYGLTITEDEAKEWRDVWFNRFKRITPLQEAR